MSFIDMMGNDRWSEQDIINRTESMIASEFPPDQVAILNRIATAAALGEYTLNEDEREKIARYNTVCLAAREAGDAARADAALLDKVLDFEAARQQLLAAQTLIASAQPLVDSAGDDVRALAEDRAAARTQPVTPEAAAEIVSNP